MEENQSLESLYQEFVATRMEKLKELIECQKQLSVAQELSNVKRAQEQLVTRIAETESDVVATKLSNEIRQNAEFMMGAMGLMETKSPLTINSQAPSINPNSTIETESVRRIEAIDFEEED